MTSDKLASTAGAGMLTCIVCDRAFETAANDPSFETIPYAGTLFYSSGHYGSTVFDPMDDTRLEIIVCDACLVARRQRVALIAPFRKCARWPWRDDAPRIEAR